MDGCPYDNGSHFPGWSDAQNWVWFCLKCVRVFSRKDIVLTTGGPYILSDALSILLKHTWEVRKYPSSNGWMSLWHSGVTFSGLIWCSTMDILTWHFRGVLGRKDTVLNTRGSQISAEAILIILIHQQEVGKHSSSNGWMFLHHSVTFPRLIWCSKLDILLEIWEIVWAKKTPCWP